MYVDITKDIHDGTSYDACVTVDCLFMRSHHSFHMGGGSV